MVFKLDPFGKETVLHSFTASDSTPENAGVVRDAADNLYGTSYLGGRCCGVVFKLDTTGKETVLHTFSGGADGSNPAESLLLNSGKLYGTTLFGGNLSDCLGTGCGVLFELVLPNFVIELSRTLATVSPGTVDNFEPDSDICGRLHWDGDADLHSPGWGWFELRRIAKFSNTRRESRDSNPVHQDFIPDADQHLQDRGERSFRHTRS